MLRRIKWDDKEQDEEELQDDAIKSEGEDKEEEKEEKIVESNMEGIENRCDMIWEGKVQSKSFNDFQIKTLRTEGAIKRFLASRNSYHYYETAKHFVPGK